jgi:hypothetical protein
MRSFDLTRRPTLERALADPFELRDVVPSLSPFGELIRQHVGSVQDVVHARSPPSIPLL